MKTRSTRGFTIVELLIVVVIIAILAAITIVAYNGIQNRANTSSAQSAANSAIKKIEMYAADGPTGKYPLLSSDLTGAASTTTYALTGVTFGTPSATANTPGTLLFRKCGSGSPANQAAINANNITGVQILYFNYTTNTTGTNSAGTTSGTGIACPAS